jgi:pyruvate dehydrogenase E2 component (dihydrolipoamide acetyltransferase)
MATKVLMEALSPTMEEGRLIEWKKKEGDPVAAGEILAEVETDKAVMDLQARAAGVLLKQSVAAGTTVPVGQVVGIIGSANEDISSLLGSAPSGPAAAKAPTPSPVSAPASTAPALKTAPAAAPPASAPEPPRAPTPAPDGATRVKASPLARRIAADRGLDLARVRGSGPEGRIVVRDLETAPAGALRVTEPAPRRGAGQPYSDVPLTQIRKTIAKRLTQSIGPIPTFYLTTEVDMERVSEAREALNARAEAERAPKISVNDIILKAAALALRQHPACNAWWQEEKIRYWNEVHIGVAVAIDEGLITPVVRHADQKSLREIATEVRDLAGRARERRLQPQEYTGSTFSVSNLGMFDIDQFTAVINPPEAGILAIGSVTAKPVADAGAVVVRRRMRVTMSCDHRVIDGALGAAFLKTLKAMLENPLALVW